MGVTLSREEIDEELAVKEEQDEEYDPYLQAWDVGYDRE